jgi:hypothetical protein
MHFDKANLPEVTFDVSIDMEPRVSYFTPDALEYNGGNHALADLVLFST